MTTTTTGLPLHHDMQHKQRVREKYTGLIGTVDSIYDGFILVVFDTGGDWMFPDDRVTRLLEKI